MIIRDNQKWELVVFCYYYDGHEYDCDLYLNEAECQEAFEVLSKNENAEFKDLPKDLYEAFRMAAYHSQEYIDSVDDIQLEKCMPDDLLDLYEDYKKQKTEAAPKAASKPGAPADNSRMMKCLAVRQPWAQLIVTGIKDIECRDAMPAPKKPKVFIAASGTKLKWGELDASVQEIYKKYEQKGILPPYKDLPTKCIVGYVDIVKASFDPVDSPWGSDWNGMKYTLRNAHELDEPILGKNKATPYFYNVEGWDEDHLPAAHIAEIF